MKVNYSNKTIDLTPAEAKKASKINSDQYNELIKARADFPTYKVVIIQNKRKSADTLKGLTYAFMEKYLSAHGSEVQIKEYNKLRTKSETDAKAIVSYGEIKKWFLAQFPEILNKRKELKEIIAAAPAAKGVA